MENVAIARVLNEIADLLDLQGENPFRIRAYRTAARTIGALATPVTSLIAADPRALERFPGIGRDLAGKIAEIGRTGTLPLVRQLARKTPESLTTLLRLPGVGPKRARLIYDALGITTLAALEKAARAGRLSALPGLGTATERAILRGIAQDRAQQSRMRLSEAEAYVRPLVERLQRVPAVATLTVAGSMRRRRETVGDVDVLATSRAPATVADRFVHDPDVARVLAHGDTRSSVVLRGGLQVDLRVVPAVSYGAALHYFTGNKAHNIAIRALGVKRGLKINEYGVFRGERRIAGRTEAEVFRAVGLPWIPPELREDHGEIPAARAHRLPTLVTLDDIRGDLQMHTTDTDGRSSLVEMVAACRSRGYEYCAITDHTSAVRVAGGMGRAGFRRQFHAIERLQKRLDGFTILKGAEVDILDDGSLDLDDATLSELDVVVVSVHSTFNLPRAAMTRRIVRALQHPRVHILGHPTGRLIGQREPYPVDMPAIVKAAKDHGVMLEVNAQPDRLDLNDEHIHMARDAGVRLVISTDAHHVDELALMRFGVDQARRGWCDARDVANTRSLREWRTLLKKR